MKLLQIEQPLPQAVEPSNGGRISLQVEVDDIIEAYGSTFILTEIFNQIGTLSTLYRELIHPTMAEILNGLEDRKKLFTLRQDPELADYIYNSLESKAYLYMEAKRSTTSIDKDDLIELATVILEILAGHIAHIMGREAPATNTNGLIRVPELTERVDVVCLPNDKSPRILGIDFDYFWVYI